VDLVKVALLAHGTRGDVQPAVAVADRLAALGHHPVLCVNGDLAAWAARAGHPVEASELNVTGFLSSPAARRVLANGRVGTLVRRATADERRVNGSIIGACLEATRDADVVVSTIGMALRGMALAAARDIPAVSLLCAPLVATGDFASIASPIRDLRSHAANRWSHGVFASMLWRGTRPNVSDLCHRLGISPPTEPPRFETVPAVHTYSGRLVPRPLDWPEDHQIVGPALPSRSLSARLDPAAEPGTESEWLSEWISAGDPVVYFGLGSMPVLDPDRMLADVAEVTAALGVRGLVVAGSGRFEAIRIPSHLAVVGGYVDHERILSRCVAAVHHGGAGTTATVARAGIPQVVLSVFLDQPFWGWRVEEAGLGVTFPFRRLSRARLTRAVASVLDQEYADRARALGETLRAEDGAGVAAKAIESYASAARTG
jgi:sterol 3beta-glucosyltransferase